MFETITFHFNGQLADDHKLNFYEAARFQYAAARLMVKLSQFRNIGRFKKRITNKTNQEILVSIPEKGSFDISVILPIAMVAQETFINVSISELMSYAFERVVGKAGDSDVAKALNTNEELTKLTGKIAENNHEQMMKALEIIESDRSVKEKFRSKELDIIERLISENARKDSILLQKAEFQKIDEARQQKLISMSAPLISEMATTLRKSADTLSVISEYNDTESSILFLNQEMAEEIELSIVDEQITPIMGNIIQYNKETGWGKARLDISDELLSFNVPSDKKSGLQAVLLSAMGSDKVYLQSYIVRNKAKKPTRIIIVGILETPE